MNVFNAKKFCEALCVAERDLLRKPSSHAGGRKSYWDRVLDRAVDIIQASSSQDMDEDKNLAKWLDISPVILQRIIYREDGHASPWGYIIHDLCKMGNFRYIYPEE